MLWRAAKSGQPDAQYLLGLELLVGGRLARDRNAAIKWFQLAASSKNPHAHLKLAWLFATSPDEQFRDGGKARAYLTAVGDEYLDHLSLFEVRAAVAAALGDFEGATTWQNQAYAEALKYKLPVESISEKLKRYEKRSVWVETVRDTPIVTDARAVSCLPVRPIGKYEPPSDECRALGPSYVEKAANYPPEALSVGQSGWAIASVDVEKGAANRINLLEASPQGVFDSTALNTLEQLRFRTKGSAKTCLIKVAFVGTSAGAIVPMLLEPPEIFGPPSPTPASAIKLQTRRESP